MVQNHAPGNSATGKYLASIFALLGVLLSALLGTSLCAAKQMKPRSLHACMAGKGQKMQVKHIGNSVGFTHGYYRLAPDRGLDAAAHLPIVRGFRHAPPPVMGISPPIGAEMQH
jgi:hypothetical protein